MRKVVIIDRCSMCPMYDSWNWWCNKLDKKTGAANNFPDDCPLDDYKEEVKDESTEEDM